MGAGQRWSGGSRYRHYRRRRAGGHHRTLGGQPGTYTTRAAVTGLEGQPVIFVTTALAAKLIFVTQPGSIATTDVPLDPQPVLQLGDPDGNPIAQAGVAVTVQIASGSGSLAGGTTATSDAAGQVAFTDLVIRGSAGLGRSSSPPTVTRRPFLRRWRSASGPRSRWSW